MRRTLALVVAAAVAALTANIMGEYVLTLWTATAMGVVVGFLLTEIVLTIARWRGVAPALAGAILAGGSVAWAGWIESGEGVAPIRETVWLGVAIAVVITGARLRPRPTS